MRKLKVGDIITAEGVLPNIVHFRVYKVGSRYAYVEELGPGYTIDRLTHIGHRRGAKTPVFRQFELTTEVAYTPHWKDFDEGNPSSYPEERNYEQPYLLRLRNKRMVVGYWYSGQWGDVKEVTKYQKIHDVREENILQETI